jgi:Mrp family chromosome partitioning ATPase
LKIGGHPKPQVGSLRPPGVSRILAIGSGKGGVGKSTVSSNLDVALARAGRRVGLLDGDIHGPSQLRMMGVSQKPESPEGQTIIPLAAHGVTLMSIGLMLPEDKAVFTCPHCGRQSHIFGSGGTVAKAEARGIPLLAQLPLDLDTRLAGDGPMADAYAVLATRLIEGGMA